MPIREPVPCTGTFFYGDMHLYAGPHSGKQTARPHKLRWTYVSCDESTVTDVTYDNKSHLQTL